MQSTMIIVTKTGTFLREANTHRKLCIYEHNLQMTLNIFLFFKILKQKINEDNPMFIYKINFSFLT